MKKNQQGFIGVLIGVFLFLGFLFLIIFVQAALSEENVSGIVYNTKNSGVFTGNTTFSVRAAVDTYVSSENKSSYCLPPHSPYIALVNKAAADKTIKVVVTTKKFIKVAAPWTCVPNVTVVEQK